MGTYITYSDSYTPCHDLSVSEVLSTSSAFNVQLIAGGDRDKRLKNFAENSGLGRVSIEQGKSKRDVMCDLVGSFMERTTVVPEHVGLITYYDACGCCEEGGVSIPHYIQHRYRMTEASVLVLNQACVSSMLALELARGSICLEADTHVLVLSCCVMGSAERFSGMTVAGDGAGLLVLSGTPGFLEVIDAGSVSSGRSSYERAHNTPGDWAAASEWVSMGVGLVRTLLGRNRVTPGDVAAYIPQNINLSLLVDGYADSLKIPVEKFYLDNLQKSGHQGDAGIIRNVSDWRRERRGQPGDLVVLFGMGGNDKFKCWSVILAKVTA